MWSNTWTINLHNSIIVGNEIGGVSEELASLADVHFELPMRGIKQSLNVSVATGIVGYELARCYIDTKLDQNG